MDTKYIFITGGVVSSLGKGIAAASIGALLEARGLKVKLMKLDPYINVDPGTMSPFQHGEVFVTDDGIESDMDLGHYERYTHFTANKQSNFTTGKVYFEVIQKERRGEYLGRTVQVIPHITDQIKENILLGSSDCDVSIIEIGGTVGDIESLPFMEAIRQFGHNLKSNQVLYIHLTLIPWISSADELKTKPTQHSVNKLREIGIQPDILLCRTDRELNEEIKKKISLFTNVEYQSVITAKDVDCIYEIPLLFHKEGLDHQVITLLQMWTKKPDLQVWADIVDAFKHPNDDVTIGIIGKYVELKESYKSLTEALIHASIALKLRLTMVFIEAEELENNDIASKLQQCDGILVPGGFGERGIEGKIKAIRYARENQVPFFGICLGMQVAVIEYARNVLGYQDANSAEFDQNTEHNVIDLMEEQTTVKDKGGTMRLGAYPARLNSESKIAAIYNKEEISERHRHRYEVNNKFVPELEDKELIFSGKYVERNLVETIELSNHVWFIGVQFHPEFKSKPLAPHPLFKSFVEASYVNKKA